ncbi:alpha/beta fold hydrolase [Enterococcus sp. AZ109]|uniref:alpha/beta hydrolase n=1 Tax=Enterococcus sp. AZ109 TaxID=2774634 RepID=UPI003F291F81
MISERINNFLETHEYQTIQLSNTTFHYLLCGSGNYTLVLLDGGLGTSESWFEYISYFETSYQILTFAFPSNLKTNAQQVSAIYELIDALKIQKPIFIGGSYGGLLTQLFTKQYPQSVEGLVLISSGGMTDETKKSFKKFILPFRLSVLLAKVLPFRMVRKNIIKESIQNMTNGTNQENTKQITEAMHTLYADMSKSTLINMGHLLLDIFNSPTCTKADFQQLPGKVLLLLPEKDFFPKESQKSLIRLMSGPDVIWIDGGAHGDPMFNTEYMEQIALFLVDKFE